MGAGSRLGLGLVVTYAILAEGSDLGPHGLGLVLGLTDDVMGLGSDHGSHGLG
jgi:hypothetical protein